MKIGIPVSTVGAALKARSTGAVEGDRDNNGRRGPASAAGKQSKSARNARPRRTFPIYEASNLREGGLSIRAVATEIDFPVSTVASNLTAHSLAKSQWANAKLERGARILERAELKKVKAANAGGLAESIPNPKSVAMIPVPDSVFEPHADRSLWEAVEKNFKTRTEPNR